MRTLDLTALSAYGAFLNARAADAAIDRFNALPLEEQCEEAADWSAGLDCSIDARTAERDREWSRT